jgi:NAD(P)-dependent dehydrogenase (short-subunit alcohol dehydrogenase family)
MPVLFSGGIAEKKASNAAKPPADAPIPTTGTAVAGVDAGSLASAGAGSAAAAETSCPSNGSDAGGGDSIAGGGSARAVPLRDFFCAKCDLRDRDVKGAMVGRVGRDRYSAACSTGGFGLGHAACCLAAPPGGVAMNDLLYSESHPVLADPDEVTLRGKVVIITGGSRGLGAATAQALGVAGAQIVIADLDLPRAHERTALLADMHITSVAMGLDVGDEAQVRQLIRSVRERFGRLDVVINNAAIDITAPISELQGAGWERVVRTNLTGPFLMTKYALEVMDRGGHIVNIVSTASKRAWPNAAAYHATKWGLLGMSHALHAELRSRGIKVSALVAGGMRTPFVLDRFPDIDPAALQDPMNVARAIRFVLTQPEETVVPEVTVLPMRETSWP